ncbi:MAG: cytochrome c [Salegentibacter sp.]
MKLFYRYIAFLFVAGLFASCADKDHRGYNYFPDMYYSEAYETYSEAPIFQDQQEAKLPVEGTIPRGWKPYEYPNTAEGRTAATENLKNPIPYTEKNLDKGKELFNLYCAICHGEKGDGKGTLVQREKILGVPGYNDPGRNITEGSVYHAMYYGLNNMGSYASQTSIKERWQIDHYVMSLKDKLAGNPEREYEKEQSEADKALEPAEVDVKINDKGSGEIEREIPNNQE